MNPALSRSSGPDLAKLPLCAHDDVGLPDFSTDHGQRRWRFCSRVALGLLLAAWVTPVCLVSDQSVGMAATQQADNPATAVYPVALMASILRYPVTAPLGVLVLVTNLCLLLGQLELIRQQRLTALADMALSTLAVVFASMVVLLAAAGVLIIPVLWLVVAVTESFPGPATLLWLISVGLTAACFLQALLRAPTERPKFRNRSTHHSPEQRRCAP